MNMVLILFFNLIFLINKINKYGFYALKLVLYSNSSYVVPTVETRICFEITRQEILIERIISTLHSYVSGLKL